MEPEKLNNRIRSRELVFTKDYDLGRDLFHKGDEVKFNQYDKSDDSVLIQDNQGGSSSWWVKRAELAECVEFKTVKVPGKKREALPAWMR